MHKFKALDNDSQMCSGGNVLFFDENARPSDLFECASYRIEAVAKLHNELSFVYNDKINNKPVSEVTSLLLADAVSMFRMAFVNSRELETARKEIDQYKKTVATLSRELAAKCDDTTKEGE
ncbi:hypothetical protein LHP66_002715 [Salmonella enterica]|nr:hypothetical protein [Salmonella enterica]EIQ8561184.1 hypothetical protein [Salmonella enterica]EIT4974035.1 hypothetical protein [Salmonella enterica]EJS6724493.1 hypothetical protein [Salmonella enterica]